MCNNRFTVRFIPLCICLAATALLLQNAYALRTREIVDDEMATSIVHWLHPSAIVFLALGYVLSGFLILKGIRSSKEEH